MAWATGGAGTRAPGRCWGPRTRRRCGSRWPSRPPTGACGRGRRWRRGWRPGSAARSGRNAAGTTSRGSATAPSGPGRGTPRRRAPRSRRRTKKAGRGGGRASRAGPGSGGRGVGLRRAPARAEAGPAAAVGPPRAAAGRGRPPPLRVALPVRLRPPGHRRGGLVRLQHRRRRAAQRRAGRVRRGGRRRRGQADRPGPRQRGLAHQRRPRRAEGDRAVVPAVLHPRAAAGRAPLAAGGRGGGERALRHAQGPRRGVERALPDPGRQAGGDQGRDPLRLVAGRHPAQLADALISRIPYDTFLALHYTPQAREAAMAILTERDDSLAATAVGHFRETVDGLLLELGHAMRGVVRLAGDPFASYLRAPVSYDPRLVSAPGGGIAPQLCGVDWVTWPAVAIDGLHLATVELHGFGSPHALTEIVTRNPYARRVDPEAERAVASLDALQGELVERPFALASCNVHVWAGTRDLADERAAQVAAHLKARGLVARPAWLNNVLAPLG